MQDYLANLPPDRRVAVETVRYVVRQNLAEGFEEGMAYGNPRPTERRRRLTERATGARKLQRARDALARCPVAIATDACPS